MAAMSVSKVGVTVLLLSVGSVFFEEYAAFVQLFLLEYKPSIWQQRKICI
jgi:hypothetical protein